MDYYYLWLKEFLRRRTWCFDYNPRKVLNFMLAMRDYSAASGIAQGYPCVVKVNVTPLCRLRCTACIHADCESLPPQRFTNDMKMPLRMFQDLVDELEERTFGMSLYYMGDPFLHPDVLGMCAYAHRRGIATHISSACSFRWSDQYIEEIIASGLAHLTVCVDGITQESYGRTRVGGRLELVLDNLKRLLQMRSREGKKHPVLEVQYITLDHNVDELSEAHRMAKRWGADRFTHFRGVSEIHVHQEMAGGQLVPKERAPRCFWPWFSLVVKWNGDVLPCCIHRTLTQYSPDADSHALGNVKDDGLLAVWNSPTLRDLRGFLASPLRPNEVSHDRGVFCLGCPVMYQVA